MEIYIAQFQSVVLSDKFCQKKSNEDFDMEWKTIDVESGGNIEDELIGTLPMKIETNGLYLISDKNATISTGEGAEQLLNFNDVTVEKENGTYNSVDPEKTQILTNNSIKLVSLADGKKLTVNIKNVPIKNETTYTIVANVTETNKEPFQFILRTTNQNNTYQISSEEKNKYFFKTFNSSNTILNFYLNIPSTYISSNDDYWIVSVYLYEGEYTELPQGSTFDILENTKYILDSFVGMTLSSLTDNAIINVYKNNSIYNNGGVLFFGDSIFARINIDSEYTKRTNIPSLSLAVGGTRLTSSRDPKNEYYVYDMVNIANAIKNNDFSSQINNGMQSNYTILNNGNIQFYNTIVIEYGTNDYTANVVFDEDGTDTIKGATKYIIETILNKYPEMRIVFISTQPYVTIGTSDESGTPNNPSGSVWQMNEIIKSVCEEYNIVFIDMYHLFGENKITRNTLTSDGVHLMYGIGSDRYCDILISQLNSIGVK